MAMRATWDPWLSSTVTVLMLLGILMVASASSYVGIRYWDTPSYLFWKQLAHLGLGLCALIAAMKFPYRRLSHPYMIWGLFITCSVLLLLVFFFPAAGGAHRWIVIGPLRIQPSEIAKLFAIVYMASLLGKKGVNVNDIGQVLTPAIAGLVPLACLIAIEPDFSSALVMMAVPTVMTLVAGLRWKYIGVLSVVGCIAAACAVLAEPYRLRRVLDFILYLFGVKEPSYQVLQSLIALGSGGTFGVGLGEGQQQAFFLPAPHTDFIFSIIGEELGLVGTMTILAGFLIIGWRGARTARNTADPFGAYLALGLTCYLVLQALIHMLVCTGLVPPTGLPLPLVSYGGSSLIASMTAVGLLLNVSQGCNLRSSPASGPGESRPARPRRISLQELNAS